MKADASRVLYNEYYHHPGRFLKVTLKNGRTFKGVIVSFCLGDVCFDSTYIIRWRMIEAKEKDRLFIDPLGCSKGITFAHDEILEVKFLDNGRVLRLDGT